MPLAVAGRHESDRILAVFTWVHCMLQELYTYSSCIPIQASIPYSGKFSREKTFADR